MPTRNATRTVPGRRKGTPKTGGRRKGTPNKVTVEARRAAAALVDDPTYRKRLATDMRARKVAPAIEQMLWYYAKGKPVEVTPAVATRWRLAGSLARLVRERARSAG